MANFQNENKNYYDEMMNEPQFFNPPDKRNGLDEPDLHQPFFMKALHYLITGESHELIWFLLGLGNYPAGFFFIGSFLTGPRYFPPSIG